MEELKKWQMVNGCETKEQLFAAVDAVCEGGTIIGNTGKEYDADKIKRSITAAMSGRFPVNVVTRRWGIRQQMLYLMYYGEE